MKGYHYEFGVRLGDSEDTELLISRQVIDLRSVVSFWKITDHKGPDDQIFPSVTNVQISGADLASGIIYYPYNEFKKLYEDVMATQIKSMPYPTKPIEPNE